jgi:cytochrome c biogenesis protein ResB
MLLYFFDVRALSIGLLLLALAGCSEPPQKEIDEAKSAIDAAQAAGAQQYATAEYAGAVATLEKARVSVTERDYRQALSYAIDARQRAIEASRLVPETRTRLKAEAETELKKASDSVAHLDSVLRAAGDAGVRAQELLPPHDALLAAKRVLQEARTALDAGKYAEANAMLRGVREKLDAEAKRLASIPQRPRSGKGRRH